ncbi:restriction endonuclease subunit S [Streptomyces mirabilis]|nr:restriction endonuclease subunit S [Streptomyces mirabilis]
MRLDLSDLRYTGVGVEEVEERDGLLRAGDLLFTRYNGNPEFVGACARVPDGVHELAYPDKLIRVRLAPGVFDSRFVCYMWASEEVRRQVRLYVKTSSGQVGIAGGSLKKVRLPLPPLAEQHRIVEALEEQLSRLGNARSLVRRARRLNTQLAGRYVADRLDELARDDSLVRPLGEVVVSSQGGWSRAQRHVVPEDVGVPYLKMNNITSGGDLNLEQVTHVQAGMGELDKYGLKIGEVLFNSKNSAELVGKSAVVDESVQGWVFNENITRIRFDSSIIPEFAALQLNSPGFRRASRSKASTNVAAIYMKDLKRVPFLVPSLGEQAQVVDRYRSLRDQACVPERYVESIEQRAGSLYRRLLSAAFNGQLVAQDHTDEPAALLLTRLSTERAGAKNDKPQRGRTRKVASSQKLSELTGSSAAVFVPAPTSAPVHAVQQEFDL